MKKSTFYLLIALVLIVGSIYYLERPETTTLDTGEVVELGPTETEETDIEVKPEVGFLAPDFLLMDYEGKTHTLKEYRGKLVALNFWASWCPFCLEEMPLFQKIYEEFKNDDFAIIAINRGEAQRVAQQYSDQLDISYPLLLNESDNVYGAYQGRAMPTTFLIDKEGVILDIKFGPYTEEGLRADLKEFFNLTSGSMPKEMPYNKVGKGLSEAELELMKKEVVEKSEPTDVLKSTRPITITKGIKHSVPLEDIRGGGATERWDSFD